MPKILPIFPQSVKKNKNTMHRKIDTRKQIFPVNNKPNKRCAFKIPKKILYTQSKEKSQNFNPWRRNTHGQKKDV